MANRIDSPEYWIEDFQPTADELDALKSAMLDTMAPAPIENLAGQLIRGRVEQALSARKKAADGKGVPYLPSDSYEKGQTLIFPALEGAKGKITAVRKGNNPMYGKYQVIQVDLEGQEREFASGIGWEHELSAAQADLDADLLVDHYASVIAPQLRERLGSEGDWQSTGNLWVLSALVPDVNAGHRYPRRSCSRRSISILPRPPRHAAWRSSWPWTRTSASATSGPSNHPCGP
jgi:hypothetical protein